MDVWNQIKWIFSPGLVIRLVCNAIRPEITIKISVLKIKCWVDVFIYARNEDILLLLSMNCFHDSKGRL